ncbi:pyridoxal-phosphate dependent enzyme [Campylobacter hyointestinalis]|uniref:Cysteine synthase A n=1 Tax=Campylobacter hyointestinalis subsp. hyointestinalis TaxID=91352 RepID=A0A9W5EUJ8_CAMHY|nr:pyridoxal-phosphate dependent enzyme [Campylobacter hyointestinalis]CUU74907.1 cysteine synthase A [Campylobacter hyointestinalis subsp. hyointestinalis]CUU81554.1 cysteine synthase A [Campylobacter hyointestinalis subsp. hyointestinalis]
MNLLDCMGRTPLIRIKNPHGSQFSNVYVKLEEFNPTGSIKARVGLAMVQDALKIGKIKSGDIS